MDWFQRPSVIKIDHMRSSVTLRDNHKRAILTDPHYRPQSCSLHLKAMRDQSDSSLRWPMLDHPSGDVTPSQADVAMTRELAEIAKRLGIAVHDHVIVAKDGHARA